MRRAGVAGALAAALLCALSAPLRAQADSVVPAAPSRPAPPLVRWGKWATAALAVGFTLAGSEAHNNADAAYARLTSYCAGVTCTIGADGRYADPRAEAIYGNVVRDDRAARAWLIGGQVAALASAVLWVLDLTRGSEPPNIPYAGLMVESGPRSARIGWRVPF